VSRAPIYLGEFECLVLLAVIRMGSEAYAVTIRREIEAQTGRNVTRGALYTTLDRLDSKDLLRWKVVAGGANRGDIARRAYSLTALGLISIRASHRAMSRMTRGLERYLADPT
jgi:DNA-binding PadR family transcriptional regulator